MKKVFSATGLRGKPNSSTRLFIQAHKHVQESKRMAREASQLAGGAELEIGRCHHNIATIRPYIIGATQRQSVASAVKPWFDLAELNNDLATSWSDEVAVHMAEAKVCCAALKARLAGGATEIAAKTVIEALPRSKKDLVRV